MTQWKKYSRQITADLTPAVLYVTLYDDTLQRMETPADHESNAITGLISVHL